MSPERKQGSVWQERLANEARALVARYRKEYGVSVGECFDGLGDVAEELSLEDNTHTEDEK